MAVIHQYRNNGYNIVMDVISGAVHVVDDLCYDVIESLNEPGKDYTKEELLEPSVLDGVLEKLGGMYPESEIRDAFSDVVELTEEGRLFVPDTYECMIDEVKKRKTVVKALCLHIAHDCNLACKYCFAEEGEYHGRRALMSFEVGKKALDFLIANSGNRRNLEVDFFGGEPLMNWFFRQAIIPIQPFKRFFGKVLRIHHPITISDFTSVSFSLLKNDPFLVHKNLYGIVCPVLIFKACPKIRLVILCRYLRAINR